MGYQLWLGGELRLYDGVIDWLKVHGVPTLASSNCVLADLWEPRWPRWVDRAFDWLLAEGFRPIFAHPERLSIPKVLPQRLDQLADDGVFLQENTRCLTGEDGRLADHQMRQWLIEGCYTFLALDSHRPDSLPSMLDGLSLAEKELGRPKLNELTLTNPRRWIFGQ